MKKLKRENVKLCTEERLLIINNIAKIRRITRYIMNHEHIDYELFNECFSTALYIAIEKAHQYDRRLEYSFLRFIFKRVRGAIIDANEKLLSPYAKIRPKHTDIAPGSDKLYIIDFDANGDIELFSELYSPEISINRRNQTIILKNVIKDFPPIKQKILHSYYFQDKTFKEIAQENNVTISWASRIHKAAIKELKESMLIKYEKILQI